MCEWDAARRFQISTAKRLISLLLVCNRHQICKKKMGRDLKILKTLYIYLLLEVFRGNTVESTESCFQPKSKIFPKTSIQ